MTAAHLSSPRPKRRSNPNCRRRGTSELRYCDDEWCFSATTRFGCGGKISRDDGEDQPQYESPKKFECFRCAGDAPLVQRPGQHCSVGPTRCEGALGKARSRKREIRISSRRSRFQEICLRSFSRRPASRIKSRMMIRAISIRSVSLENLESENRRQCPA